MEETSTFRELHLPKKYLSVVEKSPNTDRQYLGQPDMIMLDDQKTLLTVYPVGHGFGPLVMQISKDLGDTWKEKPDIPDSWNTSLETPTIYKLNMNDGSTRLILITGMPRWENNTQGGWRTSISDDLGESWSEYKLFHSQLSKRETNWSIVAMASLIQLNDRNGKPIDKWMGVYHDPNFVNYQTFLTFNKDGEELWSEPKPYLIDSREIEQTHQICEVGLFRSPDRKKIIGLGRTQSHKHPSVFFISEDEGNTWSHPEYLHPHLTGERHKIVCDPVSKRLLITFREIKHEYDQDGHILEDKWLAGDWLAWVGTYEDLIGKKPGDFRMVLAKDWTNTPKGGDTGYAGIVVDPKGVFIMNSYGHWDKIFSKKWKGHVTEDLAYIIQAKFKLVEIEKLGLSEGNL